MTPDEKLYEFWRIKERDASGKRPRPCDVVPTLTEAEVQELLAMPPSQRATMARLKAAEQATE